MIEPKRNKRTVSLLYKRINISYWNDTLVKTNFLYDYNY